MSLCLITRSPKNIREQKNINIVGASETKKYIIVLR